MNLLGSVEASGGDVDHLVAVAQPRLKDPGEDVRPLDTIALRDRIAEHDDSLDPGRLAELVVGVPEPRVVVPIDDPPASDLRIGHVAPVEDWVVDGVDVADPRDRFTPVSQ